MVDPYKSHKMNAIYARVCVTLCVNHDSVSEIAFSLNQYMIFYILKWAHTHLMSLCLGLPANPGELVPER